jgi:dienelactone hydrolase
MKFNYSPSLYHRHLMDNLKQDMHFEDGDVNAWQAELTEKLRDMVGIWPDEKVDLNVRSLWQKEHEYGTIEKIVFTSEPYADVPAYVCIPKNASKPYPFFVCLQGHSTGMHNSIGVSLEDENVSIEVGGDRDFGISAMKNGIAALCIEQRSFGERREKDQKMVSTHMCHDAVMHALKLGKTLTVERVYDVERGLDYLESRGDADMSKIGVMGNSGGGTISLYAAALLKDRLAYCMPSCSFCTFRDSIMSIYHCGDNYIPGLMRHAEMSDIMGLFAPKPVTIVAGKDDEIFPIEAVKQAFDHLKSIYAAAGAEENCRLVIGSEGHRFYADDAWPVMKELMS